MVVWKPRHLGRWSFTPVSHNRRTTWSTGPICSSLFLEYTVTSSRLMGQLCHLTVKRMMSSARRNVTGALDSPNGIRIYW